MEPMRPATAVPTVYSYVRFSADAQAAGDSVRRQTALAQAWCDAHGLVLDGRSYSDLGLSAYHGANIATGKLGLFLKAIEKGEVRSGNILLVESLDRLWIG
jgi:DNA invertase Pin-like site-specific DNA recombinase